MQATQTATERTGTHSFDVLARADWKGVMEMDPQEESLIPEKAAERDWYDLASDAQRSCRNATRCERLVDRRLNLLIAQNEIRMALAALPICGTSTERATREGLSGGAPCPSTK